MSTTKGVVLVINDRGQPRTLTQTGPSQNNFEEDAKGAAGKEVHNYHLEIKDNNLVFKKNDEPQSVVCTTPIKKQTTNVSDGTLERAKRIPLPSINSIASVEESADYPSSPFFILSPTPDSSGSTSADDSGFSIKTDGTYSFGDESPDKVRGRFILANSDEWELVLSEDPDATDLSITPTPGRFPPADDTAGGESKSNIPGILSSPSSSTRKGEDYRLRF